MLQNSPENVRHQAIATGAAHQARPQAEQDLGHAVERRTVPQCPGLALYQWNIVLPVVRDLVRARSCAQGSPTTPFSSCASPQSEYRRTLTFWLAKAHGTEYLLRSMLTRQVLKTLTIVST